MQYINGSTVWLNKSHAFIIFDAKAKWGDAQASAHVGLGLAMPLSMFKVTSNRCTVKELL